MKVDKENPGSSKSFSKILNFSSQSRFTLDESLDEPLAFVHKSSIALSKRRGNSNEDRYKNKGIQITETSLLYDSDCPPETKVDFLGDDPLFFTEVDDHVQIVSRKGIHAKTADVQMEEPVLQHQILPIIHVYVHRVSMVFCAKLQQVRDILFCTLYFVCPIPY